MSRRYVREEDESRGRHGRHSGKMTFLALLFLVVVTAVAGAKVGAQWQKGKAAEENYRKQITSDALKQEMEQVGELATVKYFYTNMARFQNTKQLFDYDVPLTTKSFTVSYDGIIRAGVDLEETTFAIGDDKVITIMIPSAVIQSHDVDMDSVKVYDEKSSIFNGLKTEDVTKLLSDQEKTMEDKAMQNGILEEAESNAKSTLTSLFTSFVNSGEFEDDYQIEVRTKEN